MKQSNNPTETFLQEAAELLEQIEANALEIRPGLDCTEHVNHLFRAFHTIKGSGAMFGFSDVAGFTHHVETALDLVRVGRMSTSPELIALLLAARDHIAALLAASQNGKPTDKEAGNIIIEELRALTPAEEKSAASTAPQPPQAPVVEKTEGGMKRFRIAFRPNVNLLTAGTDPCSTSCAHSENAPSQPIQPQFRHWIKSSPTAATSPGPSSSPLTKAKPPSAMSSCS
jgi:two-component system chemotaxis sensor kinase CheA